MPTVTVEGGHRLVLAGAPRAEVETVSPPPTLWLPRRQRFVEFTELRVQVGDHVRAGQPLASGAHEYDFPLVTPVDAEVREIADDAIRLAVPDSAAWEATRAFTPLAWQTASAEEIGRRIRDAGLWPAIHQAPDGEIPWRIEDDSRTPEFIVIGAGSGEPYVADPAIVLQGRDQDLAQAVGILRRVSGAKRVVIARRPGLALGSTDSAETMELSDTAPNDHVLVQCDAVRRGAYAWGVDVQDALAMRDAVVDGRVPSVRVIALAGEGVREAKHVRVKIGTPLDALTKGRLAVAKAHVISGGLLSGQGVDPKRAGVASWSRGVNVLAEPEAREFLWFFKPGGMWDSFMHVYTSAFFPERPRSTNVSLHGERRMCVNCTACTWVCPVGLIPNQLWKYATHDMVDEAAAMGLKRCVECGLCSYVCPSKIELLDTFRAAHGQLRAEAAEERAHRAAEG